LTLEQDAVIKLLNKNISTAVATTLQQKQALESFTMSSRYELQHRNPAIVAGDDVVLVYPGELLTIVALPGTGKTQLCEALAGAYIVAYHNIGDKDTLRLRAFSTANARCLYADTERPHDDNYKSYERIMRRVGADKDPTLLNDNGEFLALDYRCFVAIPDTELLKEEIERLCAENAYGMIIIDGALDFVASMNSEEECSTMVKWLRSLAQRHSLAIVVTLHPNKGTDTMAGHLGAMLYRYSRACLAIRPHEGNSEIKLLTNQFTNGKLSHGSADVSIPFAWDETSRMMITLPDEAAPVSGRVKVSREAIEQLFNSYAMNGKFWVPSIDVKRDYAERFNKTDRVAKMQVILAVQNGWIEKRGNGHNTEYKYASNE
jgi:archaellum biogenesis ATPase FlaH